MGLLTKKNLDEISDEFKKHKDAGRILFTTFHPALSYEEFVEGLTFVTEKEGDNKAEYEIKEGIFKAACSKALHLALIKNKIDKEIEDEDYSKQGTWERIYGKYQNYMENKPRKKIKEFWNKVEGEESSVVLIIDEINRGNVANVLGELITLIEENKRLGEDEELTVKLPVSRNEFGVPSNLYIIGTMNTADRSLVQIDVALRRRFEFKGMWPILTPEDAGDEILQGLLTNPKIEKGLALLKSINEEIGKEPDIGSEKSIGHSYLFDLKNDKDLSGWLETKILPLVYEYSNGIKETFCKLLKIDVSDLKDWPDFNKISNELLNLRETNAHINSAPENTEESASGENEN